MMLPKQIQAELDHDVDLKNESKAPTSYPGLEPGKLYRLQTRKVTSKGGATIGWIEVWRSYETRIGEGMWGQEPVDTLQDDEVALYRGSVNFYHEIITPRGILGFILITNSYFLVP